MRYLLMLLTFSGSLTEACPFADLSLPDLNDDARFVVEEDEPIPLPKVILLSQPQLLGEFLAPECTYSFIRRRILEKKTGQMYSAIFSHEDDCDGGNTYGVIAEGIQPNPEKTIATVQDSDIICGK